MSTSILQRLQQLLGIGQTKPNYETDADGLSRRVRQLPPVTSQLESSIRSTKSDSPQR